MTTALAGSWLFSVLSPEQRRRLADSFVPRRFRAGATVFYAGDPPGLLYVLRSGKVRVYVDAPDGRELTLAVIGPPEVFGELSVLDGAPRSASVDALEDVEADTLGRDAVLRFLSEEPGAALAIAGMLAGRLRRADAQAAELAFASLPARLARTVLAMRSEDGATVALTQADLASLVGASRQRVNSTLALWERMGLVVCGRGHLRVTRPDALTRLVSL